LRSSPRTVAAVQDGAMPYRLKTIFCCLIANAPRHHRSRKRDDASWKCLVSIIGHHNANTSRRGVLLSLAPQRGDGAVWLEVMCCCCFKKEDRRTARKQTLKFLFWFVIHPRVVRRWVENARFGSRQLVTRCGYLQTCES
jgi:hypothetical protein